MNGGGGGGSEDDDVEMLVDLGLQELDMPDDVDDDDEGGAAGGSQPSTSSSQHAAREVDARIDYALALAELKKLNDVSDKITCAASETQAKAFKEEFSFTYSSKQVIEAVENQSGLHGLSPEDLTILFKVITSIGRPGITYGKKQKLVFCLIPSVGKISDGFLTDILNWIYLECDGGSRKAETKISMALLQYLNGLLEYDLVSPKILQTPFIYGLLFTLHKYEVLIPWICRLLIKITSKNLLQRYHILELLDFLPKDLTPTCRLSIMEVLRYYKCLRPDLLPNDLVKVSIPSKGIKVELDPTFRKRLYEAHLRANYIRKSQVFVQQKRLLSEYEVNGLSPGAPGDELNDTVKDFYFPEFPLQDGPSNVYSMENLKIMSKLDVVRAAIGRLDTLIFIVKDPEALEVFNTWLALILHHKFGSYALNEVHRFDFLLRRCVQLSMIMDAGLAAVDDWLPGYFLSWNGIFKRAEILELLTYTYPNALADWLPEVLGPLESFFLDGDPSEQVEVWLTLNDMLIHWFKITPKEDVTGSEVIGQVLTWFSGLISKLGACDEDITELTMSQFCSTYTKLLKLKGEKNNDLEPYPPFPLWWMIVLSDSLFALEAFCKMIQTYETLEVRTTPGYEHMKKLLKDVAGFFKPPGAYCLNELFKRETKFFKKQFKKLQDDASAEAQKDLATLDEHNTKLAEALEGINVHYVKALRSYRSNEANQTIVFDKRKLAKVAPAVLHYLEEFKCNFK